MIIPRYPRYKLALQKVIDFFYEENLKSFPLDPFAIINSHYPKWILATYSEYSKCLRTSPEELIKKVHTSEGFTTYCNGVYFIIYNENIYNPRIRFTLLHEIGHIYLRHLLDFEETELSRGGIKAIRYHTLECEANVFARNALAPAPIVRLYNLQEASLPNIFSISDSAAKVRMKYLPNDLNLLSALEKQLILSRFKDYVFLKYCQNCRVDVVSLGNFCPICGSDKLIWDNPSYIMSDRAWDGDDLKIMKYSGIELDDDNKAKICPRCDNDQIYEDGEYCKICGVKLVNFCEGFIRTDNDYPDGYQVIDPGCKKLLEGNARYCPYCGKPSHFLNVGFLKDWQEEQGEQEDILKEQANAYDFDSNKMPF